jgi:hypothetical protein
VSGARQVPRHPALSRDNGVEAVEDFAQEFRDTNALSRDNFHGSPTWRGSCSTDAMVYKNYCLQF